MQTHFRLALGWGYILDKPFPVFKGQSKSCTKTAKGRWLTKRIDPTSVPLGHLFFFFFSFFFPPPASHFPSRHVRIGEIAVDQSETRHTRLCEHSRSSSHSVALRSFFRFSLPFSAQPGVPLPPVRSGLPCSHYNCPLPNTHTHT